MKSTDERYIECLNCEYLDDCFEKIEAPEEYPDGTCKTKETLAEMKGE